MKTIIKDEDQKIILTNDFLDNRNYVEVTIEGKTIIVNLEELKRAVDSYWEIMQEDIKRNQ